MHCKLFPLGIDDENPSWKLGHIPHAAERPLESLELGHLASGFLFGEQVERAPCHLRLKLFHVAQPVTDLYEIHQRSTEPTAIDKVLAGSPSFTFHNILGLLLGAHKENFASAGCCVDHKVMRRREQGNSLLEIDDVYAIPLGENVRLHLRVPALRLMAEM